MGTRIRMIEPGRHDWRPLRWPTDVPVELSAHRGCPLPVRLVELSTSGCRIWAGYRLTEGATVQLHVAGLAAISGKVVWAREWQGSIRFDNRLHPAVVGHIVARSGDRRGLPPSPFDPSAGPAVGTLGRAAGLE